MASAEEIQQEAHIRVLSKNLYSHGREPVTYGLLDRRMVRLFNLVRVEANDMTFLILFLGSQSKKLNLYNVQPRIKRVRWAFRLFGPGIAGLPCGSFSHHDSDTADNLQGENNQNNLINL